MFASWRILDPTNIDAGLDAWLTSALSAIQEYRLASARLAGSYVTAFSAAEGGAAFSPRVAGFVNPEQVITSLTITGPVRFKAGVAAGKTTARAMRDARTSSAAAAMRHAMDGGRETVLNGVEGDPNAIGWARAASGGACAFCALLASRGPVYSEDTGRFRSHDGCNCSLEPVYERLGRDAWPPGSAEYRELYDETAKGTKDPAAAFRSALDAERSTPTPVSFKNVDDVNTWAAARGIKVDPSVTDNVPLPRIEDMARARDRLAAKYGAEQVKLEAITYKPAGMGEVAMIHFGRVLGDLAKPTSAARAQFTGKMSVEGPGAARVVAGTYEEAWVHEFGHVTTANTPWMAQYAGKGLKFTPTGKSMIREAMIESGYAKRNRQLVRDLVQGDVSQYAGTNDQEFFAEVFTLFNREAGIAGLPKETQDRLQAFQAAINRRAGRTVL